MCVSFGCAVVHVQKLTLAIFCIYVSSVNVNVCFVDRFAVHVQSLALAFVLHTLCMPLAYRIYNDITE